MVQKPHIVTFSKIGNSSLGYISLAEKQQLPFEVKRLYWTYFTPEDVERGSHAHYDLQQILIAMAGKIIVKTELTDGTVTEFILDSPDKGLYIPGVCWRDMKYSHNAVQLCIASNEYDESDYIRDYAAFKKLTS